MKTTSLLLGGMFNCSAAVFGSEPRTRLPFLRKVVQDARRVPNTDGTEMPFRPYPSSSTLGQEKHRESKVLYKDSQCIVVKDAFPKSRVHCLVMPLDLSLHSLNMLRVEHIPLLLHLIDVAGRYLEFLRTSTWGKDYALLTFTTGFHSLPSLPHLHMHLISLDFDSPCLKTKKHYNSFATPFFLPAKCVVDDLKQNKRITLNQNVAELKRMEEQELSCLWCGRGEAGISQMKAHLSTCSKSRAFAAQCPCFVCMKPQSSVFRHRARAHEEALGRHTKLGVITEATEEENDELMYALLNDVRSVRKKFGAMGDEVRRHNTLLERLDVVFGKTRARLGRTVRQLDIAGVTSVKHMWLLFLFVLIVFMLVYFMIKFR